MFLDQSGELLQQWPAFGRVLVWLQGGREFVVVSEKDGWSQARRYSRDGDGTVVHVRMHILRYLLQNFPSGPR